jgi:hypothetical protein
MKGQPITALVTLAQDIGSFIAPRYEDVELAGQTSKGDGAKCRHSTRAALVLDRQSKR